MQVFIKNLIEGRRLIFFYVGSARPEEWPLAKVGPTQ